MKCQPKRKKNYSHLSPTWDVYCAGTKATKGHQRKYTIYEEVVSETLRLLSPSVPNTTVEIPVFTGLDVKDLKGHTEYLKTPFCRYATTYSVYKGMMNFNSSNVEVRVKKRVSHLVQLPDYIEQSND
jgi:hypothetical protein